VIKQGDDGDNLYIIDNGELECYRYSQKTKEDTLLRLYAPGDAFGELALLYNAPRAATIIAKTDIVAFALDRECFNHIVKDAATKKREAYEKFLSKVELLDQMDPYERSKIADALKPMKFKKGDFVVKEVNKSFFLIYIYKLNNI
jgi:cAMP-dependent protein kinase regulator